MHLWGSTRFWSCEASHVGMILSKQKRGSDFIRTSFYTVKLIFIVLLIKCHIQNKKEEKYYGKNIQ